MLFLKAWLQIIVSTFLRSITLFNTDPNTDPNTDLDTDLDTDPNTDPNTDLNTEQKKPPDFSGPINIFKIFIKEDSSDVSG